MKSIRTFDVDVNITDREVLYDYAECREVRRPASGQWSTGTRKSLRRHASIEVIQEDNENSLIQVGLLDRAWRDDGIPGMTPCEIQSQSAMQAFIDPVDTKNTREIVYGGDLEKLQPEQTLPGRMLAVYQPGDVVKGTVTLDTAESLPAEKVTINFAGRAVVNVRMSLQHGNYDHKGIQTYVDETALLWRMSDQTRPSEVRLPAKLHKFPFQFTLPSTAPGSVPPLIPSTVNYGFLLYRLKATIHMASINNEPGLKDAATYRGIWVERPFDIASLPDCLSEVSTKDVLDSGVLLKRGRVSVSASLPRKAWVRGEVMTLTVEVDNQAKSEITYVQGFVVLHGSAHCSASISDAMASGHEVRVKSVKCKEGPIAPGMCPRYQWLLPLDFSESSIDSNLVPAGKLDASTLFNLQYDVIVKVKRKGLHRNMELSIPIIVGTTNSSTATH